MWPFKNIASPAILLFPWRKIGFMHCLGQKISTLCRLFLSLYDSFSFFIHLISYDGFISYYTTYLRLDSSFFAFWLIAPFLLLTTRFLSNILFIYLPIHLFIYLSIYLFIYLSIYLSVDLPLYLSPHSSIYLSIRIQLLSRQTQANTIMLYYIILDNFTLQNTTLQHITAHYSTSQLNTPQYSTSQHSTTQYTRVHSPWYYNDYTHQ